MTGHRVSALASVVALGTALVVPSPASADATTFPPTIGPIVTGAPSLNLINPERENKLLPVLMTEVERLKQGDVYRHIMAGGGGYGASVY